MSRDKDQKFGWFGYERVVCLCTAPHATDITVDGETVHAMVCSVCGKIDLCAEKPELNGRVVALDTGALQVERNWPKHFHAPTEAERG